MLGYPQFSFWISTALVNIYISCIIINRGKTTFELVGTVLKCLVRSRDTYKRSNLVKPLKAAGSMPLILFLCNSLSYKETDLNEYIEIHWWMVQWGMGYRSTQIHEEFHCWKCRLVNVWTINLEINNKRRSPASTNQFLRSLKPSDRGEKLLTSTSLTEQCDTLSVPNPGRNATPPRIGLTSHIRTASDPPSIVHLYCLQEIKGSRTMWKLERQR